MIRQGVSQLTIVRFAPRIFAASFAAALLNWISDCACLVASILAVSGHVPWRGVLVAYAVAQLAATLPITPGGIGVVEGTLSLLLAAYGMPTETAVAAVLLYRIISFWALVPIGWATIGGFVLLQHRGLARAAWIPTRRAATSLPASSLAPPSAPETHIR